LWIISLLATLGTRRCRDSGDIERRGGLEDVEAGVGVTEVDGGPKCNPFWEIEGTLGLPVVVNLAVAEIDGDERWDGGDIDGASVLRRFETEVTRGPGVNVRWPIPVAGLESADSPVVDAFT